MTDQALDSMLRRVLLDVDCQQYGEAINELPECDFSPAFEKKMQKLIRRVDHPIRYRVAQAVACLLLAALLSGCTVLAISPEVRAAFVGWVREVYETWFVYRYTGETQDTPSDVVYCPTWVPDGYNELKQSISDDHVSISYENDEGYLLSFTYTRNRESVSVYSEHQETDVQTVMVGDNTADLYFDQREGNTNTLIWSDEKKSAIFVISAHCSGDELIKIAESVEAQVVPKELAVYRPAWLPEGFMQSEVLELFDDQVDVVYMDDEGRMTVFGYSDDTLLHVQVDNPEISKVNVNGTPADFYFDPDDTHANILVWVNPENNYIFWISAPLTREELIRMAESVELVQ